MMNCWHCRDELIWGGDHDMVTNLSCPGCEAYVEVYHKRENKDEKQ